MLLFDLNEILNGGYEEKENLVDEKPFVGQSFSCQEEAYAFYQNYARNTGFLVRKDRSIKNGGRIVRRDFYCNRSRQPPLKIIDPSVSYRNKPSCRCGCSAHLRITLRKSSEIFPEEWHVTTFIDAHNHELLSLEQLRFLPTSRTITEADKDHILLLKEAGLSVRQIIRVMELEKNIKHGELPFMEKDIRNLYTKVQKQFQPNDVMALLESFKSAKARNSQFQYAYTTDGEKRLEHLFWSPSICFEWYEKFGDVVVFDTTYKVNAYDMPCGFFVGVDNHGKTVLFGCALLRNETTNTFKWLMKVFISLMKRHPKSIITDQDPWMAEAIASELPFTKHAFCIWHITAKFSGWFNSILRECYSQWCADFYMLYRLESKEEFEYQWPKVHQKYGLHENKHIKGLYHIKHFWVPAYLREHFFAKMTTNGRSESINAFIKRFVNSHNSLRDFVKQVDIGIKEMEESNLHQNMLAMYKHDTCLRRLSPMEQKAYKLLTPFAFKKFHEEFEKAIRYFVTDVNGYNYLVRFFEENGARKHEVYWDGQTTMCTCKHFEFVGVLCRHILRVFLQANCFDIPANYFLMRWRRNEGNEKSSANYGSTIEEEEDSPRTCGDENVQCPPKSITKGRPKSKMLQSGKELAKKTRCCGLCRGKGHYSNTCPNKENFDSSNTAKKKMTASDLGINPIFSIKY